MYEDWQYEANFSEDTIFLNAGLRINARSTWSSLK